MSEPINWNELKGRLLDGRYRLDSPIAEGGFGVVFAGYHLALNAKVAIKILRFPLAASPSQRQHLLAQFVAEGQLLAKLRHPNIVSALDVGTFELSGERTAYLVLEWCGGRDLHDDLRSRRGHGGRTVASAWRLLSPICDALAHAHAAGCVHRDVKPANVMLVDGGNTKLIDFGIAKEAPIGDTAGSGATRTHSTHRAFSLHYAAPEQVAGSKTGPWTDVHALGLLFTELLVDRAPYGEDDVPLAVIDANRPTPAAFGVDVGPWEPILRRAVSAKPMDRQRDAGALRDELAQALAEAGRVQARAATELISKPSSPEPSLDVATRMAEGTVRTASASIQVTAAPVTAGVAQTGDRDLSAARTTGGAPRRRYWAWAIAGTMLLGLAGLGARVIGAGVPQTASDSETGQRVVTAQETRVSALAPSQGLAAPVATLTASAPAMAEPPVAKASASVRRTEVNVAPSARASSAKTSEPASAPSAPAKETLY